MHERLVRILLRWSLDHTRTVFVLVGVLTVLSAIAAADLRVEAGHSKMAGKDDIHTRRFDAFMREFGSPNSLVALVTGGDEAHRREVTRRLSEELPSRLRSAPGSLCRPDDPPQSPGCVRSVMARVDVEPFADYAFLFLPPDDVARVVERLEDETLGAGLLLETRGLTSLFEKLAEGMEAHADDELPEGEEGERARDAMNGVARVIDELRRRIERAPTEGDADLLESLIEQAEIPVGQLGGMDRLGYLSSEDGSLKLATIRMAHETDDPGMVIPFVEYVRTQANRIAAEVSASCEACRDAPLAVGLTGYPALIADESVGIQRDLVRTTAIAIIGVMLFFLIGFRSLRFALLGLVPLIPAVLCTLAFVRFTFDYLSILTSSFVAIMIGLGVDFAVYILVRFQEARRAGETPRQAAETAALKAGPAILTGGLTTAGAFFALSTSSYQAFAELGIMGGIGVCTPLLATLVILPGLLAHPKLTWFQRKIAPEGAGTRTRPGLPEFVVRFPAVFVIVGVLAVSAMAWHGRAVFWSFDYASMLDTELPSVRSWHELTDRTPHSTEVAAIVARDFDEAVRITASLEGAKTVARVEGLPGYLPAEQPAKLAMLAKLAPLVGAPQAGEASPQPPGSNTPPPTDSAVDPIAAGPLVDALQELVDTLVDARFDAVRTETEGVAYLDTLIESLKGFKDAVAALKKEEAATRLGALQRDVLQLRDRMLRTLRKASSGAQLSPQSLQELLPEGIRSRLAHGDRYALYVYPAEALREEQALHDFVAEVQAVSPEVTGFPISHYWNMTRLKSSFRQAGLMTLFALLLLLLLDFRSLRRTALAMLPLGLGLSVAWGGMSLLGMSYHPANVIAFPLIIGIGIDAGVHILHRYRQEGADQVAAVVRHTGRAVLLSTGTTMIAFGSLSVARHTGMSEMGQILMMGVAASLLGATLILPAVLAMLGGRRRDVTPEPPIG